MIPTNDLTDAMGVALAADPGSLGAVLAMNIHLMLAPLNPGPTTDFTTGTPATFTGSATKAAGAAPQLDGIDPLTGELIITLKEPAGGWRWECTVVPALAESVVGYCVTNNANTVTWGSALLPIPVPISAIGHFVDLGSITLRIPLAWAS